MSVKITAIHTDDELPYFELSVSEHRSFGVNSREILELRDLLNHRFPPSTCSGDGKILQDLVAAGTLPELKIYRRKCSDCDGGPDDCHMNCGFPFDRGDYVEATVSVTVDPDTGTYAPHVTEVKTVEPNFEPPWKIAEMELFAELYRKCKARGMIE